MTQAAQAHDSDVSRALLLRFHELAQRAENRGSAAQKRCALGRVQSFRHHKTKTGIGNVVIGVAAPVVDTSSRAGLAHVVPGAQALGTMQTGAALPAHSDDGAFSQSDSGAFIDDTAQNFVTRNKGVV